MPRKCEICKKTPCTCGGQVLVDTIMKDWLKTLTEYYVKYDPGKSVFRKYLVQKWGELEKVIKIPQSAVCEAGKRLVELGSGWLYEQRIEHIDQRSHLPVQLRFMDNLAIALYKTEGNIAAVASIFEAQPLDLSTRRMLTFVSCNFQDVLNTDVMRPNIRQLAELYDRNLFRAAHLALKQKRGDEKATNTENWYQVYVKQRKLRSLAKAIKYDPKETEYINVRTGGVNVHAEIQIISYIQNNYTYIGITPKPPDLYIGVSLLCCPKCQLFIDRYNRWKGRIVNVITAGKHTAAEGKWAYPDNMELFMRENFSPAEIVLIQTSGSLMPDQMWTEDASDSEVEREELF